MSLFYPLAFWTPSPAELVVIMIVALLLFGKRLPEVARNLGRGVVEFKKGLKGVEDEIDRPSYSSSSPHYPAGSPYAPQGSEPGSSSGENPPPAAG